jgi:hypothetical protein
MLIRSQIRCQTFLKTKIVSLKEKLKQLFTITVYKIKLKFTLEGYTVYKIKLKLYVLIMGYIHNYFFAKLVVIENEG